MNVNQRRKIRILRTKIEAGVPIKDSEWLPWQKAGVYENGWSWPKRIKAERLPKLPPMYLPIWPPVFGPEDGPTVAKYLAAIGKREDEVHPASIDWDENELRELEGK